MNEQELRDELVSNWGKRKAEIYLLRKKMEQQQRRDRISDGVQSVLFLILLGVVAYVVLAL